MTTTKSLVVIGPNLLDQTKGDFHVHAFGCADTKKKQYALHKIDVQNPYDFASKEEVVEFIYCDIMDQDAQEGHSEPWTYYATDVCFFPCCGDLPYTSEEEAS